MIGQSLYIIVDVQSKGKKKLKAWYSPL